MGDATPPAIPINKPSFNWESQNLHEVFKIFKYQAKYLLINGQYKCCQDQDKVGALLNWLGPKSYGSYDELDFSGGKSKTNVQHVLKAFEVYFKPTQSLLWSWDQLGGQYSSSFKTQTDFMLKLKDIANDCSFTNSNEVVKFLFLTHNQNSRVKNALLDKMKGTSTLTECLAIAKTVESTIETEKLSKTFLQNVNKPETTDIDEVNRSNRQTKHKSGSRGQKVHQSSSHKSGKGQGKCRNCGSNHPLRKYPAYRKECFRCKKPNHFKEFCRSNPKNQSQS